jgi:hypothetical protein
MRIKGVKVDNKGRAAVGFINMDGAEEKINLDIEDVLVDNGGKGIVGAARGVNLKNFFDD